jgi:hypothetical protein
MAAHTRSIAFTCGSPGCTKRATVEVYTTRNEPLGAFCARHGERRAAELRARDEQADR